MYRSLCIVVALLLMTSACGITDRRTKRAEGAAYRSQEQIDKERIKAAEAYKKCVEEKGSENAHECEHLLKIVDALGN